MEKFQFYGCATGEKVASICYPMDSTSVCSNSPAPIFRLQAHSRGNGSAAGRRHSEADCPADLKNWAPGH
jgi:hypothetical protein